MWIVILNVFCAIVAYNLWNIFPRSRSNDRNFIDKLNDNHIEFDQRFDLLSAK